jgi:uncharacterized protein
MHSQLQVVDIPGKGRGVICSEDLEAGETIEVSPVLVMTHKEQEFLDKTTMHDYIFLWGNKEQPECCVAFGYVSIYNHSYDSNCDYQMHFEDDLIEIITVKDIPAGTELTINYNGEPENDEPVWFDTVQ